MLQNAKYSVWFRTPEGEGYGVISLMDDDVSGGDNISHYTGTYVQHGDKFAATIAVIPVASASVRGIWTEYNGDRGPLNRLRRYRSGRSR